MLVLLGVIVLVAIVILAPKPQRGPDVEAQAQAAPEPVRPEIAEFLRDHSEFGPIEKTYPIPDWADGPRQGLVKKDGQVLVVYVKDGKVLTIKETSGAGPVLWDARKK